MSEGAIKVGLFVQVRWPHVPVMFLREVLGEVIALVAISTIPKDTELVLLDAILYPIEAHIHGFGSLLFD